MRNLILESLYARRSIREYSPKPIQDSVREAILSAAMQAPTAGNQQQYSVIDVTDEEKRDQLSELCDHQSFIANAPWIVVIVADCLRWYDLFSYAGCQPQKPGAGNLMLAITDACIFAQNMVMAAESFGIGSCYVGDVMENCKEVRRLLCLPELVFPCAMLTLGYPNERQFMRPKPPRFDSHYLVHENTYERLGPLELREMLTRRQVGSAATTFDHIRWLKAFHTRKYAAEFNREMNRSVREYLQEYID